MQVSPKFNSKMIINIYKYQMVKTLLRPAVNLLDCTASKICCPSSIGHAIFIRGHVRELSHRNHIYTTARQFKLVLHRAGHDTCKRPQNLKKLQFLNHTSNSNSDCATVSLSRRSSKQDPHLNIFRRYFSKHISCFMYYEKIPKSISQNIQSIC